MNGHADDRLASAPWWKTGIVYQIYPRSFQDSNGDGVGDLKGIMTRLDYLVWLGVDAVWLSPVYPSPMADFGYDVSDYTDIDPLFGTMDDFIRLRDAVHARGLKLIMDLVPNHTSESHPWFVASRRSRDNPKREWYVWHDAKPDGGPPNNWQSEFGGSAWTWDAATYQYYYHAFLPAQPDLNWRNPEVVAAIERVFTFWFDRGVDGFRLDTIQHLFEDDQWRDNPPDPAWRPGNAPTAALSRVYTTDRLELFDLLPRWRKIADGYRDRVLISEAYVPVEGLAPYYGRASNGMHLPFNFHLIKTPWTATALAELILRYEEALPSGAWPNWVLGNHDRHRIASRVGVAQAVNAAILLLTLRGTPTMYYGDELGLTNVPIMPSEVHDPWEKNVPGFGLGRDPVRTPMPWDTTPNAGFTDAKPWLPLHDDWSTKNVACERNDSMSLLSLYRRLIELRRSEPALTLGDYGGVWADGDVLCYVRRLKSRRLLVCLNLGAKSQKVDIPDALQVQSVLFSAGGASVRDGATAVPLGPHQGLIAAIA